MNEKNIVRFGMSNGVSHMEFIQSVELGRLYFLETSAQVGGVQFAELVEFSTGVNLWAEWAKIKAAVAPGECYSPVALRNEYAGLLVSLARQEWPDAAGFIEPELVWRLNKRNHVELADSLVGVRANGPTPKPVRRARSKGFHASAPPPEKPQE